MINFRSKTFWLGLLSILVGVLNARFPEIAEGLGMTLGPDALILAGLGAIFGRHAIEKAINNR